MRGTPEELVDRPDMDPLSDILTLLRPTSHITSGFHAGGDWAVAFDDLAHRIKCYAVIAGGCWLQVAEQPPLRLTEGDCFVLPTGRPFRLGSDLALAARPAPEIFATARQGGVVTLNGGGDLHLVGSRFEVDPRYAAMALATLPPIIHIRRTDERIVLAWTIDQMMRELASTRPGAAVAADLLSHLMLLQALRTPEAQEAAPPGWYRALSDPQLRRAIEALHATPASPWTIAALAQEAGMSRTAFASRFVAQVGEPPMTYLRRWRMLRAADLLVAGRLAVAEIALTVGYESEAAFASVFRKVMGEPPRRYARFVRTGS